MPNIVFTRKVSPFHPEIGLLVLNKEIENAKILPGLASYILKIDDRPVYEIYKSGGKWKACPNPLDRRKGTEISPNGTIILMLDDKTKVHVVTGEALIAKLRKKYEYAFA